MTNLSDSEYRLDLAIQNFERNRMYPPNHRKDKIMNPEPILVEVATAIKHRCISTTEKWLVVYYHTRICCVPSYVCVPPQIILCEFNEKEVSAGFDLKLWTQLSRRIVQLYKEVHG